MNNVRIFETFRYEFPHIIHQLPLPEGVTIDISQYGNVYKILNNNFVFKEYQLTKPFIQAQNIHEFTVIFQDILDNTLLEIQRAIEEEWPKLDGKLARVRAIVEGEYVSVFLQSSLKRVFLGKVTWVPFP